MNKKFAKFLTLALALVIVFCFSACEFVSFKSGDNTENVTILPYTANCVSEQNVTLTNSLTASSGVSFTPSGIADYFSDIETAVSQTDVDRAVVTIKCSYTNDIGSYASSGSGVIVDVEDDKSYGEYEDNVFYVLTCHHVINELSDAKNQTVTVYVPDENGNCYDDATYDDRFVFTGKVGGTIPTSLSTQSVVLVGGDLDSDVAVLRLYVASDAVAAKIVKAKIAPETEEIKLGKQVFAIGNPQGTHAGWLSGGWISDVENTGVVETAGKMTLFGIDVAIFPGNSGGGLFNLKGELIGITNSGDAVEIDGNTISQRLNYAVKNVISSDKTKDKGFINIAKQLIGSSTNSNYGYVSGRKVKLGITVSEKNSINSPVYISDINEDGLAYSDGLRLGDTIKRIRVNGGFFQNIGSISDLDAVLETVGVGDTVVFTVARSGEFSNINVEIKILQYLFCNTGSYN